MNCYLGNSNLQIMLRSMMNSIYSTLSSSQVEFKHCYIFLHLIIGLVKNHIMETCEGHVTRRWICSNFSTLAAKIPLGGFLYFLCCMLMKACLGPNPHTSQGPWPCNCEGPWLSSKGCTNCLRSLTLTWLVGICVRPTPWRWVSSKFY